jgi:3-phosphoshikimate 1-carboxyvinyltransferase
MNIRVFPSSFQGKVNLPSSKSWSHRALMLASLAKGTSILEGLTMSDDILATQSCLVSLGATMEGQRITGPLTFKQTSTLHANASGTTLRMLLPFTLLDNHSYRWTGEDRLGLRTLSPLQTLCQAHGLRFVPASSTSWLPLEVQGPLKPGHYVIDGSTTSQFISGLLMVLPLLKGPSQLTITGTMASSPYLNMTLAMMAQFGVKVNPTWPTIFIPGQQNYQPQKLEAEKDASHAAFFFLGGILGGSLFIEGLWKDSLQGDAMLIPFLNHHGGEIHLHESGYSVKRSTLTPMAIDLAAYPDLAPMLITTSAFIDGDSTFTSLSRLNDKESPRFDVIKDMLTRWHIPFTATADRLVVQGSSRHRIPEGRYAAFKDHRIAMTLAMLASKAQTSFVIEGIECVNKSFPTFLDVYSTIGGRYEIGEQG